MKFYKFFFFFSRTKFDLEDSNSRFLILEVRFVTNQIKECDHYHELDYASANMFEIIIQAIVGVSFNKFCS